MIRTYAIDVLTLTESAQKHEVRERKAAPIRSNSDQREKGLTQSQVPGFEFSGQISFDWMFPSGAHSAQLGESESSCACSYAKWEMMNPIGCAIISGLVETIASFFLVPAHLSSFRTFLKNVLHPAFTLVCGSLNEAKKALRSIKGLKTPGFLKSAISWNEAMACQTHMLLQLWPVVPMMIHHVNACPLSLPPACTLRISFCCQTKKNFYRGFRMRDSVRASQPMHSKNQKLRVLREQD